MIVKFGDNWSLFANVGAGFYSFSKTKYWLLLKEVCERDFKTIYAPIQELSRGHSEQP